MAWVAVRRVDGLHGRVFVVSDAAPVAGLEPGIHQCFGKNVLMCEEEHGFVVRDSVLPCLAGSAASMLQCVNYLRKLDLLTLVRGTRRTPRRGSA